MSPDPSFDPDRIPPTLTPGSGPSEASDSTLVRAKPRTTGAGRSAPTATIHIPGYEITTLLARGGMGAVYAGRDLTLDREVAVKTLLPGADSDRFVAESRITARLAHPGVPPVHALEALPDGGHFLVMKLVHGRTLAELLKERPVKPGAGGPCPDDMPRFLQVFEQIAHTVGFAHSRGVLHRDLKPLNVMVGAFGEVQVMDWGLAKDQRAADAAGTGAEAVPDSPELTRAGTVMGTPGYMAPEQARGEAVDARADVFALGAVLAAVLTGQPAFVGHTAGETIDKARGAELADVLARLGGCGADAELVALARRCLAAEPADRPADARAVAAEVAEYRAGVEARLRQAETDRARAETQAAEQRKRRCVVQWAGGGIAAVLLLGVAGTAVGLFEARRQAARARNEADAKELARADEERHRGIADGRRQEAERATAREALARADADRARARTADVLDAMVSEVTGDSLATQQTISAEQKKFLAQVVPYYREFAAAREGDERDRARVARAAYRVGLIEFRLGRGAESAAAFAAARDSYAKLVAEFPAVPEYRRELAGSHNSLGVLSDGLGQRAGAEEQYRKALAVREKLAAEFPAVPVYRHDLTGSHNNLGMLLKELGRSEGAEEQYRRGLAVQEKLAAEFPAVPEYRQELARIGNNLGNLLKELGRREGAEEQYRKALAVQEKLAAEFPAVPEYRAALAGSYNNLGNLLAGLGQRAAAEEQYRKALAVRQKLVAELPAVPEYRLDLGSSHNSLGNLLTGLGQRAGAEEQYRKALAVQEKLVAEFPAVPAYRAALAVTHNSLGLLLTGLGQRAGAEEQYRKALAIRVALAGEFPAVPAYRYDLAGSHNNLALLLKELGQRAAAEEQYCKALAVQEKLVAEFPAIPAYQVLLGGGYCNFGNLVRDGNDPAESLKWYGRAIDRLRTVHEREPRDVTAKQFLQSSYWGRAVAHDRLRMFAEAAEDWGRVIPLSPSAEQPSFRARRAASLLNVGLVAEAVAEVAELTKSPNWNAGRWYDFARAYAVASDKLADKKPEHADRAMELLQKAVNAGYKNAAHMKTDTDLAPLRGRADFKTLLADLEKRFPTPLPVAPPPREKS